jgi:signal transduction histidine kinase
VSRSVLPIGHRFGLIYVLLTAALALLGVVVVSNLRTMRTDSAMLLEENREARLASELVAEIELLGEIAALRSDLGAEAARLSPAARRHLDLASTRLRSLMTHPDAEDPSRSEHQAAEQRLAAVIGSALHDLERDVGAGAASPDLPAKLAQALRYARILEEETGNEAGLADRELAGLVDRSTRVVWGSLLVTAVVLALSLAQVMRKVVRPLQTLRAGADRFGAGDLAHRIALRNRDEIGALARSFNQMADRLSSAQQQLEARVQERTRQFVAAARLADLGGLAAGIAHEINNPLGSIASCAEGLDRRLRDGTVPVGEQRDYLQTIAAEAWRARDITGRLLTLARQDAGLAAPIDLGNVCQQLERLVRHRFETAGVELILQKPERMPPLTGNQNEITQMLVNLLLNALDASPRGGRVWLRCDGDGARVHFIVEDEGVGIAEADLPRVFEPFYTTKEPGKGTGLGLSLVAAIVENHGGAIDVRRGRSGGALFDIALPAREVPT